ncbi:Mitochondrial inner membrane peptidase complex subunit [Komagataella phaffii]|uniref:Mitochondrial inner membrane protease subunit 2 n=2 Tax=Komagataella phaffii TaxID=460519 RepID=C4QWM1_KOMPG|nr:Catalytic subunit of the mitochondrial inner membrane peptidase complex [Komagataella phaffii GS115]AOA61629.1 GQ67_02854T0 [Komagataella phaffii]AOA66225.1 GQ68_02393T0 [Komagataella phaffii GS115]CAY67644.1 Catalytic subunit of the mitochondrial inner membrane peptidase complex [Komagataella phaffii GS115]
MLKHSLKTGLVFLTWIPVIYTVKEHLIYVGKVEGSSMSPTLNPVKGYSDYVILWKLNFKESLKVGDVVFIRSPVDPEKLYAKRIKAVQGDTVVTRHPYPKDKVSIPRNHLWVEGDNIHSVDSNNFGPISLGLVLGRATHVIFPLNRIGNISGEGGREVREDYLRAEDSPM